MMLDNLVILDELDDFEDDFLAMFYLSKTRCNLEEVHFLPKTTGAKKTGAATDVSDTIASEAESLHGD